MPDLGVARPYATALFDAARGRDAVDVVEGELHEIAARLVSEPDLLRMLRAPQLRPTEKRELVEVALAGGASELVRDFLRLLLDKERIGELDQVIRLYVEMAERARGLLRGTVTTAVPLAEEEREALTQRLGRLTGQTVILAESVDPSLLGGVVVKLRDRLLDSSVKSRLAELRQILLATHAE